jgi:type I restriction enzyme R subunit
VDDGATVPIYYESRPARLDINQAEIEQFRDQVEEIFEDGGSVAPSRSARRPSGKQGRVGEAERLIRHYRISSVTRRASSTRCLPW